MEFYFNTKITPGYPANASSVASAACFCIVLVLARRVVEPSALASTIVSLEFLLDFLEVPV